MLFFSVLAATMLAPPLAHVAPRPVMRDSVVISGTVRDAATQLPIEGANVLVQTRGSGRVTGRDGRYRLAVQRVADQRVLTISARRIGYTPATRQVNVTADFIALDIALASAPMHLSSVVVSGSLDRRAERKDAASAGMSVSIAPQSVPTSVGTAAPAVPITRAMARERDIRIPREPGNREQYANIVENPFLDAARTPLSTFGIDVDRAAYANVRRFLDQGMRPPRDAVRIEELVNYFAYDYAAPARGGDPLSLTIETHDAPWQPAHRLVRIGMQAQRLSLAELPPANLVFLIDVSGSMQTENKLPLVIASLRLLTEQLREQDHVAIAVYAGAAGLVLPSTPGSDKARILAALDRLQAGGSTNGAAGLRLAYRTAREHFVEEGANRVILATDGDFNVGTTSDSDMIQLIEAERKSGVNLTVLGFGMGNIRDAMMEQIADKGNGQYAYIDNLAEARKSLVREMSGTLFTLAKDVKLQVEFNPARVRSYRLIGYENRALRDEDFNDDTKDAGELGAGHSVTALYEVELTDSAIRSSTGTVDPLRYGTTREPSRVAIRPTDELAFVKVRYQPARGGRSTLRTWAVTESAGRPSTDFMFASAVAGFGLLLRDSEHKGRIGWPEVRALAERGLGADPTGDRAGFLRLVSAAERVATRTAAVDVPR
ncbi:MAG: von Willebrand factor type A domain-containing protein [Gemmatimonadaceae bacterium]|nr:von Willebrand factor type A domain-containing protein [Gemmatimonadaceae bacterium]